MLRLCTASRFLLSHVVRTSPHQAYRSSLTFPLISAFGFVLASVLIVLGYPGSSEAQTAALHPVLECVTAENNGTYTALFGYKNDNTVSVTVPVGANNKFTPSPIDRGQTTVFMPGRIVGSFHVNFNGSNLVWTLKSPDGSSRTSTASSSSSRCVTNQPPIVVNDSATTFQGVAVTIAVLANDSDPEGTALTVSAVGTPAHGSAVINADNTVTYQPVSTFIGTDSFSYTARDAGGATSTATVTVTVIVPQYTLSVTTAGTGGGTVASSPTGITCGATCSASFNSGTAVTLTATPDGTSTFTGWSGACTGTGHCIVTMTAAKSVTATFNRIQYVMSVTTAGTGGGTVASTPAGITCGATCSASFNSGTAVTLTVTPDGTSTFTGWSGACTGTGPCVVTMNAAQSVTATFTRIQHVFDVIKSGTGDGTVASIPAGITCGATCSASFDSGTVVTLTATPDGTSTFTGWSGSCTGTGPCVVTMNAAASVTATFTRIQYVMSVTKAGTGGGTVGSVPAGITCGATCSAAFDSGTVVTLTATPDGTSTFAGWSGACTGTGSCVVTMTVAQSVTATFTRIQYVLNVTKSGTGSGTVLSALAGITCGATCSASFDAGTVITLTATPDGTSTFTGWSGSCTGTGSCVVTMTAAQSVTATFTRIQFVMSVTTAGTGGGSAVSSPTGITCGATCSASFNSGTVVMLTAMPDGTSTFTGWSGSCTGTGTCLVTMTAAQSVTATFARIQYVMNVTMAGTGGGSVASTPAGIACGATCAASFDSGMVVTLTATPYGTSTFAGWSGSCTGTGPCIVTMDTAKSVTATFTRIQYALSVTTSGTGGGSVASTPAGIACGATCSALFDSGTAVTLMATADGTSTFTGWSGSCTGTGPCVVTMNAAKLVTATFVQSTGVGLNLCISQSYNTPRSFHIFTMDFTGWVERGVLHFPVGFYTQTLDLTPYLPDAQGLYRVRLNQKGVSPARIGGLDILSGSVKTPPDILTWVNTGQDLLPVLHPDTSVAPDVFGGTIDAQWNTPPQGQDITLVMNALEGGSCNENLTVNESPVTISGKVDDPAVSVVVNDQSVFVDYDGSFFIDVDLQDGSNTITAIATDPSGNPSTRSIQVVLDQTAPVITLNGPDNVTVSDPIQTITGTVDDPSIRLVTAESRKTNSLSVVNGQFSLSIVLLPGENQVNFSASDSVGNVGQISTTLILDNPSLATLAGEVTDAIYGNPLPGARVVVTDPQRVWNDVTDEFGTFVYPVTEGPYTAVIHLDGYVDQPLTGTTVAGTNPFLVVQLVPVNPSAPLLSGISLSDITDRTAVVHWSTDQPAGTTIAYGPTASYGSIVTIPRNGYSNSSFVQLLDGLPSGTTMHLQITATNAIGLSSSSGDLTFTTDTPTLAAPSVTPFTPPFTRLNTATATGTAPEGTEIQLYVNGFRQSVALISEGLFSAPIGLGDGLNMIAARAVDGLGNVSSLSPSVPLTFDTARPEINNLSFVLDSFDLLTSHLPLEGTTSKPGTTVQLVIDSQTDAADQTAANTRGEFCFCDLFLHAGSHLFEFKLTDLAGNVATYSREYTVHPITASANSDFVTPSITPLDPRLHPIDSPRSPGMIDISGQAYASGYYLFSVEISLDGAVLGTVLTDASGRFVWPNVELTTGTHVLQARQLPAQITKNNITVTTNPSNPVQETVIVMDSPPPLPMVTVLVPADGGTTNVNELPIRGTVSDPAVVLTTANSRPFASGTITSAGGSYLSDFTVALHPGDNPITVIATGNDGTQSSRTVLVSLHPLDPMPVVTLSDPSNGTTFVTSPISASGNADPVAGGEPIGFVVVEKAPLISAGGPFTASVDLAQRYGPWQILAWAQDQSGKVGRGQIQAFYQPGAVPSISITSPIPQANLTTSPITVTGLFANAISVTVNGIQAVLGGGTFTAGGIVLNPGINTLTAIATSAGGQLATAQINVVFSPTNATLTGLVTDGSSGLAIAGATITITDSTTGTTTAVQTDTTGHFTATIGLGDFDLTVTQPGYSTVALHGTANGSQPLNLTFSLYLVSTTGVVTGTVTDATTGLPLSQASVSAVDFNSHVFSTQTGSNGNYSITGLAPGAFTMTVSRSGYVQATGNRSVSAGGVATFSPALQPAPASPGIGNLTVTNITTNSATIHWTTNQLTNSLVSYGPTSSYGSSVANADYVTVHNISLVGLTPNTTYHFKVTSVSTGGTSISSTDMTFKTLGPITVTITSPLNGDVIGKTEALVQGTITGGSGQDMGVTVNGVLGNIYGGEFVANHVPLTAGTNTLTVTAKDISGMTATASVTVQSVPAMNYITLSANPESGVAPMQTTVTIDSTFTIASSTLYASGPGSAQITGLSLSQFQVNLTTEGIYFFTANVTDGQGVVYTDTFTITALNLTQMDTLLQTKWNGMTAALNAGDIASGLSYFVGGSQEKYQAIFQDLLPSLPQIFGSVQALHLLTVGNDEAEMEAIVGGDSYPVIFMRDETGIWKLWGF